MESVTGSTRFRLLRLLAVALGVVAALAGAELVLRLAGEPPSEADALAELAKRLEPPPLAGDCGGGVPQARLREFVVPSPHPDVIYELRPNVATCFEQVPVRINSEGVRRGRPLATPKPEETYRVLTLGDSHAFGWGIPEEATVAAQLEDALRSETGSAVEVVNAGVPGFSAFQEAAWLAAHGPDLEPDCVIVLFVANDMGLPHFLLRPKAPGPSRLWDRLRAATESKRWFRFAPNELATFVDEVQIDRIPERYRHMVGESGYREALRALASHSSRAGFDLVNVFDYSTLDVDSEALAGFQRDLGITAIEMPWPKDPSLRISASDPHLNRAGNGRIVQALVPLLTDAGVCRPGRREG